MTCTFSRRGVNPSTRVPRATCGVGGAVGVRLGVDPVDDHAAAARRGSGTSRPGGKGEARGARHRDRQVRCVWINRKAEEPALIARVDGR